MQRSRWNCLTTQKVATPESYGRVIAARPGTSGRLEPLHEAALAIGSARDRRRSSQRASGALAAWRWPIHAPRRIGLAPSHSVRRIRPGRE
jgi:hypothetical protein